MPEKVGSPINPNFHAEPQGSGRLQASGVSEQGGRVLACVRGQSWAPQRDTIVRKGLYMELSFISSFPSGRTQGDEANTKLKSFALSSESPNPLPPPFPWPNPEFTFSHFSNLVCQGKKKKHVRPECTPPLHIQFSSFETATAAAQGGSLGLLRWRQR